LIAPQVLALAGRIADPSQRQRAFVAYGAALGLGAAVGPLIGCAIVELDGGGLGWRAVFAPQALLALAAALRAQPWRPGIGRGPALDVPSVALLASSTLALVVPLIEGRRLQWPAWLLALPLLTLLGLAMFWRRQRHLAWHHGSVLVDPAVMQPRFVRALLTVLCFYGSNASCILIVSLWLRGVFELRPLAAAALYTLMSGGFLFTTFASRRWFERWGERVLGLGACALAAGQLGIAAQLALGSTLWALAPTLLFTGAAFGVVMSPLVARAVGAVPLAHTALAGGVVGSVQWLGNALGVALIGSLYFALAQQSPAQAAAASHVMLALLAIGVAWLLRTGSTAPRAPTERAR
jgi:predicted MFS family arabinose efflux permease